MSRLDEALKSARQKLNIERKIAYLGDGSGEAHDRDNPGQYLVRFPTGSDTLSAPVSLPAEVNANFPATDGLTVEIGMRNGKPVILGAYYEGLVAAAINPLQFNPIDEPANKFVSQSQITTFYATRHADTVNNPFYAVVFPGFFRVGSTLTYFAGSQINLSSFLPASPNHCYAVIFIKTDGTLEAFASTAIDVSDPLTITDIQEALNSATAGSIPVWAWELAYDDALLTVDPARQVDIREIVGGRTLTASDVPAHAHSIHTGLTTGDDHTQYFLLAGRAGGQTAIGGTAASENLILNSTAHATKGSVLIGGSTLRIDEALTTVGIKGAAISAQAQTIYTDIATNIGLVIKGAASQSANLQEWKNSSNTTQALMSGTGQLALGLTALSAGRQLQIFRGAANTADTQIAFATALNITVSSANDVHHHQVANLLGTAIISSGKSLTAFSAFVGGIVLAATNAGTLTTGTGFNISNTISSGASGAVTTFKGINLTLDATAGAGTVAITTYYQIVINGLTSAILNGNTIANAYGIYIADINGGSSINSAITTNAGNIIFNSVGDGNTVIRMAGDNDQNLFCTVPATDHVGIGTNAAITKFHILLDNATTATVDNTVTIEHSSTGTPAAGFGAGLAFALESSTTAQQSAGLIETLWATATHASRKARMVFSVFDTAVREGIRIEASGTVPMLGFFGVNAVVKPTALTTALTTITHTAPGTPDYAIQDFTQTSPWGFADHDEANSVLKVIANLQTRTGEIETKLQALGLLT